MPKGQRRRTGNFAGRPLALRRELLDVLGRVDKLTARELAAAAFSGRLCRSRPSSCSPSQVASVRRSLRQLIDRNRVVIADCYRGRKVYSLAGRELVLPDLGSLDG